MLFSRSNLARAPACQLAERGSKWWAGLSVGKALAWVGRGGNGSAAYGFHGQRAFYLEFYGPPLGSSPLIRSVACTQEVRARLCRQAVLLFLARRDVQTEVMLEDNPIGFDADGHDSLHKEARCLQLHARLFCLQP